MNKIQRKRVEKLIAALRGDKYGQQKEREGSLKDNEGNYDVLGLACELSRLGKWEKNKFGICYKLKESNEMFDSVLPFAVCEYYGFRDPTVTFKDGEYDNNNNTSLAVENDSGVSFSDLAAKIEYCLENNETEMFV